MIWEGIKIFGLLGLLVVSLGIIGYFLFGWIAVVALALIVAIPVFVETSKSRKKKRLEMEAQAVKEQEARVKQEKIEREWKERQEQIRAQQVEYERKAEQRRKQREELLALKEQAFFSELASIPVAKIELSADEYKRRALRDMPEIKFTNITKRTNPLTFTSFVVVDVETTGIPRTSKIVELSAIRFEGFEPVEKLSTLVNPECSIPQEATAINGITDEMVADAPTIWEVMPAFRRFVGNTPVVGHNLAFDLEFLYAYGFDLDNPKQRFYDTLQLAKSTLIRANCDYSNDYDVEDYKLGTLCDHYNIYLSNAHRACSDCLATGKLFEKLAKIKMQ